MKKLLFLLLCLPLLCAGQVQLGQLKTVDNTGAKGSAAKTYKAIWILDSNGQPSALMMTDKQLTDAKTTASKNPEDMPALGIPAATQASAPYGFVNVQDLGLKPDYDPGINENKWTENGALLQRYLSSLPKGSKARLYFPAGEYHFFSSVTVKDGIGIEVKGPENMPYLYQSATTAKLYFGMWYQPITGFNILGSALTSSISDIWIIGTSGPSTSGVYHEAIVDLKRVYVERFDYGFYTFAGVENGQNASLSMYTSCRAAHNGRDGFYAGGPDANVVSYINCVSVENGGYGFNDASFLGCEYFGCQSDGNAAGGRAVMQATAQTTFTGCYDEGGQPASYITPDNGQANVFGGINPNGWTGALPGQPFRPAGGCIQEGRGINRVATSELSAARASIAGLSITPTQGYGEPQKTEIGSYLTLAAAGAPVQSFGYNANHLPEGKRSFVAPVTEIKGVAIINGIPHIPGTPDMPDQVFFAGDIVGETWVCTQPGRNTSTGDFKVSYLNNYGGEQRRQVIQLSDRSQYDLLRVGDFLNFPNGCLAQVNSINKSYTVEVENPAGIHIHPGDRIDYFGGWDRYMQPVGYSDNSLTLSYTPEGRMWKAGDKEIIDGAPAAVKSVRMEQGLQLVEFDLPEGGQPAWYTQGNGIGWTSANIDRRPVAYDWSDEKRPTITLAFPMADLQAGATVLVDNVAVKVLAVTPEMITAEAVSGNLYNNQAPTSFTIQQPHFEKAP